MAGKTALSLQMAVVALLAEGVGRNWMKVKTRRRLAPSPSSRRAWVEIYTKTHDPKYKGGRPPRGGRG